MSAAGSAAAQLAADYLFLGPVLEARLDAALQGAWPVQLCERAEQVLAADKRPRVLMLMWAGDRFAVGPTGQVADAQLMYQQWLAVLAVNNVGKQPDARVAQVGSAMFEVHRALHGFKPEGLSRAFARTNARMAPVFTESKAVYPLAFEIPLFF